jgi:MFS family permease
LATPDVKPAPERDSFPILWPLRVREFLILWAGGTGSFLFDQLMLVALSAYLIDITRSAAIWSTYLLVEATPRSVLSLFSGVAVDRFRSRRVLIAAFAVRFCAVGTLAVLAYTGTLTVWKVLVYGGVIGSTFAFLMPAYSSLIPQILPPARVQTGNAFSNLTNNILAFLAPPAAGLLVASRGSAAVIAIAVLSASLSLAAALRLTAGGETRPTGTSPWVQLGEGFAAARQDPVIWRSIVMSIFWVFGWAASIFVGMPALSKLVLQAGDAGTGILMGSFGVGSLIGALLVGSVRFRRPGVVGGLVTLLMGLAIAAAGLAPSLWSAVPFLVVAGLGSAMGIVIFPSLVQVRARPEVRGRVIGLNFFFAFGLTPVAFALAAAVVDRIGPRGVIVGFSSFVVIAALYALSGRELREVEIS